MIEGLVSPGELTWSGEHWINYLRLPGASSDSGMVSLFNIRWSPAGNGMAAWVWIPGDEGLRAICSDHREVTDFIVEIMAKTAANPPYDDELPVMEASFSQGGDIRRAPSWTIHTGAREIVATWTQIRPVVIANGTWPPCPSGNYCFSLLHFADGGSISLDGRLVGGAPYTRDIWQRTIGGQRSSCVFALAESFIRLPAEGGGGK
ncbi:MAG TPA: hypothetical protein EYM39_11710 [Candidatus Latescibacteria bacterium]|nr:hypothetical protein [Candidatus Latescibacterota bacterium]